MRCPPVRCPPDDVSLGLRPSLAVPRPASWQPFIPSMDSYLLAAAAVALARGARRNVEHKVASVIKVRLFCLLVWYGSEAGKVSGWQMSLIDRPLVASGNAVA